MCIRDRTTTAAKKPVAKKTTAAAKKPAVKKATTATKKPAAPRKPRAKVTPPPAPEMNDVFAEETMEIVPTISETFE